MSNISKDGPEVEAQVLISTLAPPVPLKSLGEMAQLPPWLSAPQDLPDATYFRLWSRFVERPLWSTQGCSRPPEAFRLEVALENVLPLPLHPPKTVQKHAPFSHNF